MAWLPGWIYRKQITVADTNVDGNLSNFPLLVQLDEDTDVGAKADSGGDDIRFTASDGVTEIPFEFENWDVTDSKATSDIWVKVTSILSTGGATIYMYYGNAGASNGEAATDVWDSDFVSIWHMDAADPGDDSTGNHDLTDVGTEDGTGKVGRGRDHVRANEDRMHVAAYSADYATSGPFTVGGWIDLDDNTNQQFIFGTRRGGGRGFMLERAGFGPLRFNVETAAGGENIVQAGSTSSGFKHCVCRRDGSNLITMVLDGVLQADTDTLTGDTADAGADDPFTIGSQVDGGALHTDGRLDEVRYSDSYRNDDWCKFEYNNVNEADNELTIAAQEAGVIPKAWYYEMMRAT